MDTIDLDVLRATLGDMALQAILLKSKNKVLEAQMAALKVTSEGNTKDTPAEGAK